MPWLSNDHPFVDRRVKNARGTLEKTIRHSRACRYGNNFFVPMQKHEQNFSFIILSHSRKVRTVCVCLARSS
jgi:hypothetical protein